MRKKHTVQRSIFEHYAEHEIGQELKAMSEWLEQWERINQRLLRIDNTVARALLQNQTPRLTTAAEFLLLTRLCNRGWGPAWFDYPVCGANRVTSGCTGK